MSKGEGCLWEALLSLEVSLERQCSRRPFSGSSPGRYSTWLSGRTWVKTVRQEVTSLVFCGQKYSCLLELLFSPFGSGVQITVLSVRSPAHTGTILQTSLAR